MKVVEFLSYLNSLDIKLWLEGEKLRYQAPKGVMTPEIKEEIAAKKPEILDFLRAAKIPTNTVDLEIIPVSRDQDLPLSFAQQRLWFLQQLSPDSHSYNLLDALRLEGNLNLLALEQSLSELIRRHEILRTTFPMVEGQPIQRIAPPSTVSLPLEDLQGLSKNEQTEHLQEIAIAFSLKPFNLAKESLVQFKLLKLGSQEYVLLLKMHHIIYDGWSLSIFFGELSQLYAAFVRGLPSPLPELSIQYADFAVWQRQWLTGEVLERQLNYWQKQLQDAPTILELPTDYPRPPIPSFRGDGQVFRLNQDLTQRLKRLSQESGATLFMTLLAAFFVLISRYSGQLDVLVGSPIANRNSSAIEKLMGFFANTLALRGDMSGNPSFLDLLERVKQTTLSAYAHQDLPFEMLVEKLQLNRDLSHNPLIQVMFSLQNTPQSEASLSGLKMESLPLSVELKARFDLEVNFWEVSDRLEAVWCYSTDLFAAPTINQMGQHFQNLLTAITANPNMGIFQLSMLSDAERDQLLASCNETQTDYSDYKCIHELFEEQVERTPNAVAVVFEGQQLTYAELNSRANQLAHYLQSLELKLEDKIGVCIERSPLMVIAILAILKAGGAYVPLDIAYPSERLAFMLENVQCPIILTQNHLSDRLPVNNSQRLIDIDSKWESITQYSPENIASKVTPNNLAYIIYTSGSTGTPKGTEVVHRNIIGFIFGVDYVQLDAHQIWLQHSSISWDALTLELWTPLLFGGRCVLYPGNVITPENLSKIIKEEGVNILWLTCALFNLMIDTMPESLLGVKQLITGGETLSVAHIRRGLALLPKTQIINGYGPSECTVFTCCYPISKQLDENLASIPIGKPIGDRKVYLLDRNLQPVPVGVSGEIHVGGASVARGYLNQLALTCEKFISNPFLAGDTLYKTGDLARYLPDGNIEYIGRIDNQVKIRGFRIELGEIESVLSQNQAVQSSCVIVREDNPGEKQLVAYIVPKLGVKLTSGDLRQFLSHKLPGYMVPGAFVLLEFFPLTANGKIDRRALKAPSNPSDSDRFIEARNQLELSLVQIWSKVLKIDKVSVQDNFFDLGGHSLLAPYLITQIKEQLGEEIAVTTLFQNPTIEQLATIIKTGLDPSNQSYFVPIQPHGSKPPFFCVPGAGGRPFYFYHLGRYLGKDQPFYSFENDLYQQFGEITRIEDIASIYLKAMQDLQPQGPYFLGGHSYGGNVAFEMAQQLVNQGEQVALLAIIDSSAPTYKDKQILLDYINWDHARWLAEVSKGIEVYLDKTIDISYETLQLLTVEEQLKYALNFFKLANMLPPNAETRQLAKIVQAYKTSCLCLIDYLPKQTYPGKITIIRASEELSDDPNKDLIAGDCEDSSLGWSEFSTEPVEIHFVLGNHVSIMVEPHVQILAEELKVCLEI
ncbi:MULTISPECIES: amino acid adenylation domain-containing protein [unclassified Microcystis]|uniref:Non-ribosomal peptide synthetase n=1 Tax=Microcystis flos-aquae Mf_QC_C_20070823_S10D TaxID=2486236 RepID=A0A552L8T7_9CHRO|nr:MULTISPECIES: amino acid adenylation domain-containing protein [unclassified Microcystis]MCA2644681.1 amino acid adenylation domain-containing protein [Microcystis sp. M069S2]MCA2664004.1 amino acid adenylation domain-containing protein [Microcystis sp. M064S2]MCA2787995.1 amino acid adenylation domain-containing protein [Microcystis sp. M116S2]MCA2817322.1 amino acid adenylation domain-containing protein [Microcystis sp. M085S1]MCA2854755.1 amino acid adenylation domain-containing protein 